MNRRRNCHLALLLASASFAGCSGPDPKVAQFKSLELDVDALQRRLAATESARQQSEAKYKDALAKYEAATAAPTPAASAAFEPAPTLTAKVYEVEEQFATFAGKCMFFDQCWVDGDVELKGSDYVVRVKDDREKTYTGFSGIKFICSKPMADAIRDKINANAIVKSKIYCAIHRREGFKHPIAEVYKVDVYNRGGEVAFTIP